MKTLLVGLLTTIVLFGGCKREQVDVAESIIKQPLPEGGYTALQLAGKNWPSTQYTHKLYSKLSAVSNGGNYGFSFYMLLYDKGLLRGEVSINAIPLKVGKTTFPTRQQVIDGYALNQPLPTARYLIQDDDEPHAGYVLDDKVQNTLEIQAIDVSKNYVKGRLDLHFIFDGTDANWEVAQRIDREAKYRTFVLAGEFEIGKP